MKEGDVFLNLLAGTLPDYNNLIGQGMTPVLKPKDDYWSKEQIKEKFINPNTGDPDEQAFNQAYNQSLGYYNGFQQHDYNASEVDSLLMDTPLNRDLGLPTLKNPVSLNTRNVHNPYGQNIGITKINELSERTLTDHEVAQSQEFYVDSTTGKKVKNKKGDAVSGLMDFFSTEDHLVLATYEEDGTHKDPTTGQLIPHKKGERKIDQESGAFFYETLGGRDVTGKEFMTLSNSLTDEGSFWNKYDFMDSDDRNKHWLGTVAKTAATFAPAFIPYVGQAYAYGVVGKELVDSGAEIYKSISSAFGVDKNDQTTANYLQGWSRSLSSGGVSEYSKNNMMTFENLGNLVSSIGVDLKSQVELGKLPGKLKALMSPKKLDKYLQSDYAIKKGLTRQGLFNDPKELYKSLDTLYGPGASKRYADISKYTSHAYNVALASREVADMSDQLGLEGKDRGAMHLAGIALTSWLFAKSPFETWALPKIGADETSMMYKKALTQYADEIEALKFVPETEKLGRVANIFNGLKSAVGESMEDALSPTTGMGAGIAEAIEEMSEVVLKEGLQSAYNGLSELGLTETKNKTFKLLDKEFFEELAMSGFGGGLGGYGFKKFNPEVNEDTSPELIEIIQSGYGEGLKTAAIQLHKQARFGSKKLSLNNEIIKNEEGEDIVMWKPVEGNALSHNDVIFNTVMAEINKNEDFVNSLNVSEGAVGQVVKDYSEALTEVLDGELSSDEILKASKGQILNKFVEAKEHTSVRNDITSLTSNLKNLNFDIARLSKDLSAPNANTDKIQSELDTKKAEYNKVKESLDEITTITNPESKSPKVDYYHKQAMFSLKPEVHKGFGVKTQADFMAEYETEEEALKQYKNYMFYKDDKGRSKALDMLSAFSDFEAFQKDSYFPKSLEKLKVAELDKLQKAQDIQGFINKYVEAGKSFEQVEERLNEDPNFLTEGELAFGEKLNQVIQGETEVTSLKDEGYTLTPKLFDTLDIKDISKLKESANESLDGLDTSFEDEDGEEYKVTSSKQAANIIDKVNNLFEVITLNREELINLYSRIINASSAYKHLSEKGYFKNSPENQAEAVEEIKSAFNISDEVFEVVKGIAEDLDTFLSEYFSDDAFLGPLNDGSGTYGETMETFRALATEQFNFGEQRVAKALESKIDATYVETLREIKKTENSEANALKTLLSELDSSEDLKLTELMKEFGFEELSEKLKAEHSKGLEFVDSTGNLKKEIQLKLNEIKKQQAYVLSVEGYNPLVNNFREKSTRLPDDVKLKREFTFSDNKLESLKYSKLLYKKLENYRKNIEYYYNALLKNEQYKIKELKNLSHKYLKVTSDSVANVLTDLGEVKPDTLKIDSFDDNNEITGAELAEMRKEFTTLVARFKEVYSTRKEEVDNLITNGVNLGVSEIDKLNVQFGLNERYVTLNALLRGDIVDFFGNLKQVLGEESAMSPLYHQETNNFQIFSFLTGENNPALEKQELLDQAKKHHRPVIKNIIGIDEPPGAGKTALMANITGRITNNKSDGLIMYSAPGAEQVKTLAKGLKGVNNTVEAGVFADLIAGLGAEFIPKGEWKNYIEGDLKEGLNNEVVFNTKDDAVKAKVQVTTKSIEDNLDKQLIILDEASHLDKLNAITLDEVVEQHNVYRRNNKLPLLKVVAFLDTDQNGVILKGTDADGVEQDGINFGVSAMNLLMEFTPKKGLTLRNQYAYVPNLIDGLRAVKRETERGNNTDNDTYKSTVKDFDLVSEVWKGTVEGKKEYVGGQVLKGDEAKANIQELWNAYLDQLSVNPDATFMAITNLTEKEFAEKYDLASPEKMSGLVKPSDKVQGGEWDYVAIDDVRSIQGDFKVHNMYSELYTVISRSKKGFVLNTDGVAIDNFEEYFPFENKVDDKPIPNRKIVLQGAEGGPDGNTIQQLKDFALESLQAFEPTTERQTTTEEGTTQNQAAASTVTVKEGFEEEDTDETYKAKETQEKLKTQKVDEVKSIIRGTGDLWETYTDYITKEDFASFGLSEDKDNYLKIKKFKSLWFEYLKAGEDEKDKVKTSLQLAIKDMSINFGDLSDNIQLKVIDGAVVRNTKESLMDVKVPDPEVKKLALVSTVGGQEVIFGVLSLNGTKANGKPFEGKLKQAFDFFSAKINSSEAGDVLVETVELKDINYLNINVYNKNSKAIPLDKLVESKPELYFSKPFVFKRREGSNYNSLSGQFGVLTSAKRFVKVNNRTYDFEKLDVKQISELVSHREVLSSQVGFDNTESFNIVMVNGAEMLTHEELFQKYDEKLKTKRDDDKFMDMMDSLLNHSQRKTYIRDMLFLGYKTTDPTNQAIVKRVLKSIFAKHKNVRYNSTNGNLELIESYPMGIELSEVNGEAKFIYKDREFPYTGEGITNLISDVIKTSDYNTKSVPISRLFNVIQNLDKSEQDVIFSELGDKKLFTVQLDGIKGIDGELNLRVMEASDSYSKFKTANEPIVRVGVDWKAMQATIEGNNVGNTVNENIKKSPYFDLIEEPFKSQIAGGTKIDINALNLSLKEAKIDGNYVKLHFNADGTADFTSTNDILEGLRFNNLKDKMKDNTYTDANGVIYTLTSTRAGFEIVVDDSVTIDSSPAEDLEVLFKGTSFTGRGEELVKLFEGDDMSKQDEIIVDITLTLGESSVKNFQSIINSSILNCI